MICQACLIPVKMQGTLTSRVAPVNVTGDYP